MKRVPAAPRAIFAKLDPVGIVLLVLLGRVRPLLALGASELNRGPILDSGHLVGPWHFLMSLREASDGAMRHRVDGLRVAEGHSRISVMAPAPTVWPPSRMAKRWPVSSPIEEPSSTPIWTLSPGITISAPSLSEMEPVTSVVRR